MSAAYEGGRRSWWQPVSDLQTGAVAIVTVLGTWRGPSWWVAAGTVAVGVGWRRRDLALIVLCIGLLAGVLGERAWEHAVPRRTGPFDGWATLVTDPQPVGRGVKVVVEIDGERFEAFAYGSPRRRLLARQGGERVELVGTRTELDGAWARRAQVRHVVGELVLERVGGHDPGSPLARANNRVRGRLRLAAEAAMPADQAALFTGLVIGDDTRQPDEMIEQFRTAGLSHLTAVSGQNVAFVLAVVGVGLRRLRPGWRWGATVAVVAWFVLLTRVEPSVLRAGTMAALSATGFALGRERSPARLLSLAVVLLVLFDPLLVWSVAFWLSSGATFGVTVVAPAVARRLAGPAWLVDPVAVTIGAQVGVLVPSWLVFHRLPVMGVPANLLAVPVAGFVMLYGIPAALVAAAVPAPLSTMVMLPAMVGTRWVSAVASLAARLEPAGSVASTAWIVELGALAGLCWARWRAPPSAVRR